MQTTSELPLERRQSVLYSIKERLHLHTFNQQQKDFIFLEITPAEPYNFTSYDCIILSADMRCLIEVKIRTCSSTQFQTSMIEKSKFNKLILHADDNNCQPYYWNFYSNGVVEIYNLNEAPKTEQGVLRQDRQMIHSTGKTDSPCYLLHKSGATTYNYPIEYNYKEWSRRLCKERFPGNDFNIFFR
jgi:hypothetical protein